MFCFIIVSIICVRQFISIKAGRVIPILFRPEIKPTWELNNARAHYISIFQKDQNKTIQHPFMINIYALLQYF